MEIKLKIPTFFPKYRIVKRGGLFFAQVKGSNGWYNLDKEEIGETFMLDRGYDCGLSSFEEAMSIIEREKIHILWRE